MASREGLARLEYDGEYHVGLVPYAYDSIPSLQRNRSRLSQALNAQWVGGDFSFARGRRSPLLRGVEIAGKGFGITSGPVHTSRRTGCALLGINGSRVVPYPESSFSETASTLGGSVSQLVRVWEEGDSGRDNCPVLVVSGNGHRAGKLQISGRRWTFGSTFLGERATVGIDCESRDAAAEDEAGPPCGFHYFHDLTINECETGIRAMGGHYTISDNGGLTYNPYEQNCDQCVVERIAFYGVSDCFKQENGQAVGWSFRDISTNNIDGQEMTIFNAARGGDISCDKLCINHPKTYLYRQGTNLPFSSYSTINNVRWDYGVDDPEMFLCLYKWDGPEEADMSNYHIGLEVTGLWPRQSGFDATKIIQVPRGKNFPLDGIRIKMVGMPTDHFIDVGGGFFTPDPAYWAA